MYFQHLEFTVNNASLKGIKLTGANSTNRNPTHTIILLDTSESMDDINKLSIVKKSLYFLLHFFQSTDSLSLITFNERSNIIIDNKFATQDNLQIFNHTIFHLTANGCTNLSAGLLNVKNVLDRDTNQMKTGLIILTDGHTNEGLTKSEDLIRIIQNIRSIQSNISINTIGYGETHNAILLKDIAIQGNGSYNIVNNAEEVGTVFGDVLGGLISCVVQNVMVKYPKTWTCLNKYPSILNNEYNIMNIGDIYSESETILLFENTDSSSVSIQGTNTSNLTNINKEISWNFNPTSITTELYIVTYIRLKVSICLIMLQDTTKHIIIREIINNLSTIITNSIIQSNPLIPMLQNEINSIKSQLDNNYLDSSQNIQHSTFLGLSRGISCHRNHRRNIQINNDDITRDFANINIQTPFANATQRAISQGIQQLSQDPLNQTQ